MTEKNDSPSLAAAVVTQILNAAGIAGIILVVLKITDTIVWPWWAVLMPWFLIVGFYVLLFSVWALVYVYNKGRESRR